MKQISDFIYLKIDQNELVYFTFLVKSITSMHEKSCLILFVETSRNLILRITINAVYKEYYILDQSSIRYMQSQRISFVFQHF